MCECDVCLLYDEIQCCFLCNKNGDELTESGDIPIHGNANIEECENFECHHWFCSPCRFWMHKHRVTTCRICDGDISKLILQESCPKDHNNTWSCHCNEEDESYSEEEVSEEEPENLT